MSTRNFCETSENMRGFSLLCCIIVAKTKGAKLVHPDFLVDKEMDIMVLK
jgi:hypothetical protein